MPLFSLDDLAQATAIVREFVPPTPSYAWPLLEARLGLKTFVKHENHTPTGSFKARGGLTYVEALRRGDGLPAGIVTATRGNHGQSIAFAATRSGTPAMIVAPEGNSREKNAAMKAFGAELIVSGVDFDASRVTAAALAEERGYLMAPSFHPELVKGVATYAYELFTAVPDLRRRLCADWHGVGDLRADHGAGSLGASDGDCRRRGGQGAGLCAFLWKPGGPSARKPRRPSPTAWRVAIRSQRRWTSYLAARRAYCA